MDRTSNFGLGVGVVLVAALLVGNAVVAYLNIGTLRVHSAQVIHTQEVLDALDNTIKLAVDAETGQRGFLITGEEPYLLPYHAASKSLGREIDLLQKLTQDNPQQQSRIPELRKVIDARMERVAGSIELRRTEGFESARAVVATGKGKKEMDAIRGLIDDIEKVERELLEERQAAANRAYQTAVTSELVVLAVGLLLIAAFIYILRRALRVREEAAEQIFEQKEVLQTTLASIGDAVISTDTAGRVTFLNHVAELLTGWKSNDAAGIPLETVFHIVNEDTRKSVENPALRALREGAIVGLANHTILISKDGTERPIDDSAAPIRDARRTLIGAVLVFRDITDRKRAEAEVTRLLSSEKLRAERLGQLAAASATINSANTEASLSGVIQHESRRIIGASRSDVQFGEVELPCDGDDALIVPLIGRSGRTIGFICLNEKEAGKFDTEDRAILLQLAHMSAVALDNARLYEELREGDRRKDEFLATLAHELRNPLAPIRNALQVMRLSGADPAAGEQARTMIERQVQQLVRLVDDLLDISRISRGKLELRKERVELNEVVNNAVESARPLIDSLGHKITVSLPTQPIHLVADPTRLSQIILNLLNNAAKYTDQGGHIWLTADEAPSEAGHGREVLIRVRDTGIGIPQEMLPRIFEMFTQVDHNWERSQGGLGIGLTLVKRLVEMHGGRIEVHSDGAGRGSEFTIGLPQSNGAQAEAGNGDATGPPGERRKRRILAVDDNRDSVESLATLLRLMGHEVRVAFDGVEAVDSTKTFEPQVVLLDIGLPRLNGFEAARRIRELPGGAGITLVALTGWGQEEDRRRSKEAGFDHHMVKPVDPAALESLLASLR